MLHEYEVAVFLLPRSRKRRVHANWGLPVELTSANLSPFQIPYLHISMDMRGATRLPLPEVPAAAALPLTAEEAALLCGGVKSAASTELNLCKLTN